MEEMNDFNNEPVYYCKHCLSLAVKVLDDLGDFPVDYCDDCGGTAIATTDIDTWQEMYRNRYKIDFLTGEPVGEPEPEEEKDYTLFFLK